jgi:hypothetical protein
MDPKLVTKWIGKHKTEEDKYYARMLIEPVVYISFDEFKINLLHLCTFKTPIFYNIY